MRIMSNLISSSLTMLSMSITLIILTISLETGKVFAKQFEYDYVTCGSVVKLLNTRHNVRLHSHDVKYGSGSGQQSVTAVDKSDDHNSYWQVMGKMGTECTRGTPIKCGTSIRLLHVATDRNLHSHHFSSPLSHNLEVSAFGEQGDGDEGDNWTITCTTKYWQRNSKVRIKHIVTESFLHVTGEQYGRPIHGQREVSAFPSPNDSNQWQTIEGIFVKPSDHASLAARARLHDEL